ncbi:MAG: type II secretion system major pseudopilin GspG [Spirochaetales bacterium]|nr:type II secretion system major pseudopilin GspG [Spirochaetales bacterium]
MTRILLIDFVKKIKSLLKNEDGWTFVETLIVISIVLILTSTVGFMAFRYVGKAKIVAAKTQIENLSMALDTYFMDNMRYPIVEQGLASLWKKPILEPVPKNWDGPYLKKNLTKDPWENDYEYVVPGPNGLPYGISSPGADGNPGGEGDDRDIRSWEN